MTRAAPDKVLCGVVERVEVLQPVDIVQSIWL